MINLIVGRLIKKHGLLAVLVIVGDMAVKLTKTKKDDKAWAKIRKVIKSLYCFIIKSNTIGRGRILLLLVTLGSHVQTVR